MPKSALEETIESAVFMPLFGLADAASFPHGDLTGKAVSALFVVGGIYLGLRNARKARRSFQAMHANSMRPG